MKEMEFVLAVIPAFLVILVGYIGQKLMRLERKSVSAIALYLMYPFLAFRTFYNNELTIEYFYILVFCILLCVVMIVIVKVIGKMTNATRTRVSAMILSGVFMNSGNYGTPIILFAFGTAGFDYAIIMMVIQSILMNTVGVYYAAKGGDGDFDFKKSLLTIFKMPVIYGALAGVLIQGINLSVPAFLMQSINLIADAAIPTIMIVLGMQLASISRRDVQLANVSLIVLVKMLISPVVAAIIIVILPIEGLLAKILIVLAAMPSAANTTMFSLQFNTEPDLVSYSTLITTLLSVVTIPLLLALL
jgi:malate permease and related proteins